MFSLSSINWCEQDYVKSNFIAEYWNTITGIFLCTSAIFSYYENIKVNMRVNMRVNVKTLYYSNYLLFIVGLGTIMFHGTLIYFWQLFDEIPMMLIVIEYYRILTTEIHYIHNIKLYKISYKSMFIIIPNIIISYYINPKLQVFLFQGSLTVFIILIIYTCYKLNKQLNKLFYNINPFKYIELKTNEDKCYYKKKSKVQINYSNVINNAIDVNNSIEEFKIYLKLKSKMKHHNYRGLFILFFSLLIWNIDNHYCQHNIQLHAIWHITTSIGMYDCNEIMKIYMLLNKQLVQK